MIEARKACSGAQRCERVEYSRVGFGRRYLSLFQKGGRNAGAIVSDCRAEDVLCGADWSRCYGE